jgi:hypothetical protein
MHICDRMMYMHTNFIKYAHICTHYINAYALHLSYTTTLQYPLTH